MTKALDESKPIQITENIWWTGFADFETGFSNNSYLVTAGSESVLIDPGPAHPVFRDVVVRKIREIIPLENIRYIILQHQDPDICGLVPYIENILHPELTIICHPRTALFIPYYGIRRGILPVGNEDTLLLSGGKKLTFYHLPYLHFSGNIGTYDPEQAALFSSDIFAFFDRSWRLYVNKRSLHKCRAFIENYFGSEEALKYAYNKLKNLDLRLILSQHGGVIKNDIDSFLNLLRDIRPAKALHILGKLPNNNQMNALLKTGLEWFKEWKHQEAHASNLEELYELILQDGPSQTAIFLDEIEKHSREMGVNNPLLSGRTISSKTLRRSEPSSVITSVRRRYIQKFYSKMPLDKSKPQITGFNSFKSDLMIVFMDIRKFTQWCEDKKPDQVMQILNEQHGLISKTVEKAEGRVNKVLGDGLLVYFPANGLEKCLDVLFSIPKIIAQKNLLPMGIGCDVGSVIMGDIGRESRLDYTLVGQPVNMASRICNIAGENEVALSNNIIRHLPGSLRKNLMDRLLNRTVEFREKPHDPLVQAHIFTIQ